MTTELPREIHDYFVATNAHDTAAMSAAFLPEATVCDEGRDHHGRSAIWAWMDKTIERYDYQVEPLEWSRTGPRTSVLVSLRGRFPGTPLTLHFDFTVEGQKIARLEIG
jgi:hypothetical protein